MNARNAARQISSDWVGIVRNQVESMRFGVVQITVHESRVVQIDKTEKVRLEKNEEKDAR